MSHSWLYSGEKAFVLDVTAVLILLVIFLLTVRWLSFPKNLPPGPLGLPLVGYLPFLTNHPYLKFTELSKKYGSVFTVWFGSLPVIIVSGYDAVYEAFATREHDFMERPHLTIPRKLFGYDGLIFGAYGERWKNTRKFTMTALRDFGVGKATLEERIIAELEAVTEELDLTKGAPFNPRRIMKQAASNVICSINFGERFEYSDKRFQHLMNLTDELFSMRIITNAVNVMPILRFIPNGILPKAVAIMKDIRKFTQEVIDEHRSTFDPNAIRDFVDYYLLAQQESAQVDSAGTIIKGVHLDSLSDSHLFQIMIDLFNAGTETTATSLGWLFLYLLKHPDVQRKVQQEIDTVIGHDRRPSWKDRDSLPYTHAMIVEMQRHANIAAIGPPHAPLRDTSWHRYNIPRKSMMIANLWSVHHDPKYWPNADTYDPERWLDKDGKFIKHEAFIPFLIGRRQCLGQQLANMELFLFISLLLQRFTFKVPPGEDKVEAKARYGVTRAPEPYRLVVERREQSLGENNE